jgi:hypothetical protein
VEPTPHKVDATEPPRSEVKHIEKETNQPTVKEVVEVKEDTPPEPIAPPQAEIAPVAPIVQPPAPVIYAGSDNAARDFIFSHESGNRLDAVNSIGCYGLGQSCGPGLAIACPDWSTNLNCQLVYWDNYAASHCDYAFGTTCYGGWQGAYAFWIAHHYW